MERHPRQFFGTSFARRNNGTEKHAHERFFSFGRRLLNKKTYNIYFYFLRHHRRWSVAAWGGSNYGVFVPRGQTKYTYKREGSSSGPRVDDKRSQNLFDSQPRRKPITLQQMDFSAPRVPPSPPLSPREVRLDPPCHR